MLDLKGSYQKSCFVKTSDQWCGNYYEDGTTFYERYGMNADRPAYYDDTKPWSWDGEEYVELKISRTVHTNPASSFVRVAAWGNDDLGIIKDFTLDQTEEAEALYAELQHTPDITRELLLNKGFEYF